jgi:hypothetical protein
MGVEEDVHDSICNVKDGGCRKRTLGLIVGILSIMA